MFFVYISSSQEKPVERLILDNADLASGEMTDGNQRTLILTGNVQFHQGEAVLKCDKALQFVDQERTLLTGNVSIIEKSKQMYGDTIDYNEKTQFAIARGHVKMVDSTKTLTGDFLKYYQDQEKVIVDSNVTLFDNSEFSSLAGRHAEYYRNTGYAQVTGQPVFTQTDTSSNLTLTIRGVLMEMFHDGDSIKVDDQVHITRGEMNAKCGKLLYIKKDELVILDEAPYAFQKNDHITGSQIELKLVKNKVKRIRVNKDAIVVSRVDSLIQTNIPYDLLTGEEIWVEIKNDEIDSVLVKGRATSYYHIIEKQQEKGINKILCDELLMVFAQGKVTHVTGSSAPGMSTGVFFPPAGREKIEGELKEVLMKMQKNIEAKQFPALQIGLPALEQ